METPEDLRRAWHREDLAACSDLAVGLSADALAIFAGAALKACLAELPGPQELSAIAEVGKDRRRWSEAHLAFDAARDLTLKYEESTPSTDDPNYVLLFVAENAARVIYNATSPSDPFDDDSATWLLRSLARFVRVTGSAELEHRVWQLLASPSPSSRRGDSS
jgi:hypothetical protein